MKKSLLVLLSSVALGTVAVGSITSCRPREVVKAIEITLEAEKTTIRIGQTTKVTATVENNVKEEPIVWKSLSEAVATVSDDGTVTGVGAGTVKITATIGEVTQEISITVQDNVSITLEAASSTIRVDETTKVTATITHNYDNLPAVWSSENDEIATVAEDGTVTGHKAGEVAIECKVGTASKTVTIKVQDKLVVDLKAEATSIKVGETTKVTPTVEHNYDNLPVSLTSSDEKIATVAEDGTVTGVAPGTVTITLKVGEITKTVEIGVEAIPVESITIETTDVTLGLGQTLTIEATILPENATDKSWTLSSADELSVSVDGHTIKAEKVTEEGKPIVITATAGEKTAAVNVTVKKLHQVVLPELQAKLDASLAAEQAHLLKGTSNKTITDATGKETEHENVSYEVFDGIVAIHKDKKSTYSQSQEDITYGIDGDQLINHVKQTDKEGKVSLGFASKAKPIVEADAGYSNILRSDAEIVAKSVDLMGSLNAKNVGVGYFVGNKINSSNYLSSQSAKDHLKYSVADGVHHLESTFEDYSYYHEVSVDLSFDETGMIKTYVLKDTKYDFADLDLGGKGELYRTETWTGATETGTRRDKSEHTLKFSDLYFTDYAVEAIGGGYPKHAVTESAIGTSVEIKVKAESAVPADATIKFDPITIKSIAPADCAKVGYGTSVNLLKATDELTITTVSTVNKVEKQLKIKVTIPPLEEIELSGVASQMLVGEHILGVKALPTGAITTPIVELTANTAGATAEVLPDNKIKLTAAKQGSATIKVHDNLNPTIAVEKTITFYEDTVLARADILGTAKWGESISWADNEYTFAQSAEQKGTTSGTYSFLLDYETVTGTWTVKDDKINLTVTSVNNEGMCSVVSIRFYSATSINHLLVTYNDGYDDITKDVYIK